MSNETKQEELKRYIGKLIGRYISMAWTHDFKMIELAKKAQDELDDIFKSHTPELKPEINSGLDEIAQKLAAVIADTHNLKDGQAVSLAFVVKQALVTAIEPLRKDKMSAEKMLHEAMADLEWFQKEWSTKSSLSTRINRVDWTIGNIKDFLKGLPAERDIAQQRLVKLSKLIWETRWVNEEQAYMDMVGVAAEINSGNFETIDKMV